MYVFAIPVAFGNVGRTKILTDCCGNIFPRKISYQDIRRATSIELLKNSAIVQKSIGLWIASSQAQHSVAVINCIQSIAAKDGGITHHQKQASQYLIKNSRPAEHWHYKGNHV